RARVPAGVALLGVEQAIRRLPAEERAAQIWRQHKERLRCVGGAVPARKLQRAIFACSNRQRVAPIATDGIIAQLLLVREEVRLRRYALLPGCRDTDLDDAEAIQPKGLARGKAAARHHQLIIALPGQVWRKELETILGC